MAKSKKEKPKPKQHSSHLKDKKRMDENNKVINNVKKKK